MMKKQLAGIVLAISVAGGAGTGVLANAMTSDKEPTPNATTATPTPTAAATTTPPPTVPRSPDQFVLAPGAVGPVKAGMSKAEALATGYFNADVPSEGCEGVKMRLAWKDDYADSFDVYTLRNGEITSIGVLADGITTADGIGKGSTYDEVRAAYPEEQLVEAGYSQSGIRVFDFDNGGWLGFLFDPTVDKIKGDSPVTFVEVTKSAEPGLMRDGC